MIIEIRKSEFINNYNNMTVSEMANYYNVKRNQIEKTARSLGLSKHYKKMTRYDKIKQASLQEMIIFIKEAKDIEDIRTWLTE